MQEMVKDFLHFRNPKPWDKEGHEGGKPSKKFLMKKETMERKQNDHNQVPLQKDVLPIWSWSSA